MKLIVTDQSTNVPKSVDALSLIASVHVPFPVPNNAGKLAVVGVYLVGGFSALASGANVPVKGVPAVPNETTDDELITVFVKLSPEPPLLLTRFNTSPLGAFRFIIRSPSQV